ncbi:thioesterase superfamily protein [Isosphaera pallida ATCC 43644]|uniref:Thioesterase superfamily protein n=1 Tax=Isosphaera pallida (strain ATCC 43644 / DSM 9630 / IS1B) TaxID=575540 RepID=E8R5C6_ISOPI|nr:hotdog domain-containing protein [Isosphaera pallida]ADV60667.1 thioesterase superfamily protein [Isosphaera pallida ATCC 43644]
MKFRTRRLVLPKDLNSSQKLFGGRLLEWIDEECGIHAMLEMKTPRVVTKVISQIDFKAPAVRGDVIEIGIDTIRYGRTSITLRIEVFNRTSGVTMLTIDQFVMVSVDEHGQPTPHGVTGPETEEA